MKQLQPYFYLIFALTFVMSCKRCSPEQINPGVPGEMTVQLNGGTLKGILEIMNPGCSAPQNFNADVEIIVRTAMLDANGNIVPNIDPFFEQEWEEIGFNGITNTKLDIKVPTTGAFLLTFKVQTDQCSDCCKDRNFDLHQNSSPQNDPHCDGDNMANICSLGKPVLVFEEFFLDKDWTGNATPFVPNTAIYRMGNCRGCAACPDTNCF
jgi:hypothetical protein